MYKIATLNKLSPSGLSRLPGDYIFTDDTEDAEGIIVRSHDMLDMTLSKNLLAIARAGAGTNNIPISRCSEQGVVVFNTPGANANAVKELVLSALLLSARNLPDALEWIKTLNENVAAEIEKGKGTFAGNEIKGKTLGVIGLGAVGVLVANAAEKLGMYVLGHDPFITVNAAHELSNKIPMKSEIGGLLPNCDYITIHVPAMESTNGMVDKKMFALMKRGVCFLNFSRGNLVNEQDLFCAIEEGIVKKYITDFPNDNLVGKNGIICIPHLGASTEEAEDHCAIMAADQIADYLENGNITNSVNFPSASLGPFEHTSAVCRVCIMNRNIPAMLAKITGILSHINISDMINKSKGDYAYTIIDIDSETDYEELIKSLHFEGIIGVRIIK